MIAARPITPLLIAVPLLFCLGAFSLGAWGQSGLEATAAQSTVAKVQFSPSAGLMNEAITVRITGLRPGSRVEVVADTVLLDTWRARATFAADLTGTINVDRQAPIDGTYRGIDPMGLFTSGRAMDDPSTQKPAPPDVRDPIVTTFRVEQEGTVLATVSYGRRFMPPNVRHRDVREDGLVGELFQPAETGRRPALLVLGGSEGGIDRYGAAGLAARGYAVPALAYFRLPSLPGELVDIPVEYPLRALAWLRRQPAVDSNRVDVYGGSRGAELALVLASMSRDIRAVAAFAPSNVTWAGVGPQNAGRPSWTMGGRGLPMVGVPFTLESFRAAGTMNDAAIPLERSRAAMFLVTGGQDRVWPIRVAPLMGEMIVARLKENQYKAPVEHWSYAGAGHSIRMFYLPGALLSGGGGTPEANAAAVADLAPRLFSFLRQHLTAR